MESVGDESPMRYHADDDDDDDNGVSVKRKNETLMFTFAVLDQRIDHQGKIFQYWLNESDSWWWRKSLRFRFKVDYLEAAAQTVAIDQNCLFVSDIE